MESQAFLAMKKDQQFTAIRQTGRRWMFCLLCLCLTLGAWAFKPFRFAVVTDIHINVHAQTPSDDLRQTVAAINSDDSTDFVLVTGDIADAGDGASLRMAHDLLSKLNKPWYIIEGNHDQNWSESGCMDFLNIFGYERFTFEHKGIRFIGIPTGPMMRMAMGHVAPEDIDYVTSVLRSNGKGADAEPVFLVSHMPMQPADVDNWYELTDAIRPYPVVAFINGHYHRDLHFTYDGIPGIVNVTNLRQKGHSAGQYNLISLAADSIRVYTQAVGGTRHCWLTLPFTTHHDDDSTHWAPRPSYAVNDDYPQVTEQWTRDQGAAIFSSPVVWSKRVYAADNAGRVVCYDHEGQELWRHQTGARIIGTPAIGKGIIVVASADSCIYGLDAKSGQQRWCVRTGAPSVSAVTITDGTAYVGSGDHRFRAIRVSDGTVVWQADGIKGYVETRPLVIADKVVFGDWANTLYCLDRRNGQRLWTWQPPNKDNMHYSPAGCWPVAADGCVFICDPERAMTAIDLNSGQQRWRTYQSKVLESIGLSQDGRRLYAKTMQDSIVCYAADGQAPRELWATDCGFGYEHARVMLVEKDGVVFASNKDGLIMALDGKTGRLLWKHKAGNTMINTVEPLSRNRIVFTNEAGKVGEVGVRN